MLFPHYIMHVFNASIFVLSIHNGSRDRVNIPGGIRSVKNATVRFLASASLADIPPHHWGAHDEQQIEIWIVSKFERTSETKYMSSKKKNINI